MIYSLAAGARFNEETSNLVKSSIKAIGSEVNGKTIDLSDFTVKDLQIGVASDDEIKDTGLCHGRKCMEKLDSCTC